MKPLKTLENLVNFPFKISIKHLETTNRKGPALSEFSWWFVDWKYNQLLL